MVITPNMRNWPLEQREEQMAQLRIAWDMEEKGLLSVTDVQGLFYVQPSELGVAILKQKEAARREIIRAQVKGHR